MLYYPSRLYERCLASDVDAAGEAEEWRGEVIDEIAEQISKLDQDPLTNSEKYVIIAGRPLSGEAKATQDKAHRDHKPE